MQVGFQAFSTDLGWANLYFFVNPNHNFLILAATLL